ncbi:MAG: acyltransferase family protein [Clostridiales bacterium]|nr:acyltransferase family protein [Clostridiales bacterium]
MVEKRSKSNKKFMVLSAIGIFMVIDHHTFTALNLFGSFIPYNSFFMPMFVFISGYFNKVDGSTNMLKYIGKKLKTLMLPYIALSLLVFGVEQLLNILKTGEATSIPSGYLTYVLDRIITIGSFGSIAAPMWFVIALFSTLVFYAIIKRLLSKIWNSYVMLAIFCALHLLTVYIAKTIPSESLTYFLIPLKILFFLPFIELGVIYRDKLENKHAGLPGGWKVLLLGLLLVINMIRTVILPNAYDVAFDSIDDLSGFTSPYIITPLISAVIGILFWLTIVDLISKPLSDSKFVNYMSCNTFWIMSLHIIFFNIFNLILMLISENIISLKYFDSDAFRESEWYFWEISPNIKFAYVIIGILGPLGVKLIYDKSSSLFYWGISRKEKGN